MLLGWLMEKGSINRAHACFLMLLTLRQDGLTTVVGRTTTVVGRTTTVVGRTCA